MKTSRWSDCADVVKTMASLQVGLLIATTIWGICPSAKAESSLPPGKVNALAAQHFICDAGYDRHRCLQQVAMLVAELRRYPADLPANWSWVIVGSEAWQPLTQKLRLDQRSPAFTAIDERETFLEEALFSATPSRTNELVRDLRVPFDQLLSIAVSHELGHAICHVGDEAIANRVSEQLRSGKRPSCGNAMKSPSAIEEEVYRHSRWSRTLPWR
jgi:hypothetical protein